MPASPSSRLPFPLLAGVSAEVYAEEGSFW
jgi:hypothetical protein